MKRVAFILKSGSGEAGELLERLTAHLRDRGHVPLVSHEDRVAPQGAQIVPETELSDHAELAVALGGDGTMLRAAQLLSDRGVPVLGINLGRLGFLTPFRSAEAERALEAALAGELEIAQRSRLEVTYEAAAGEHLARAALNDVVIHQGAMARLIEVECYLDNDLVTIYRADGLIIASPTGSTAYNLAAGGPIIMPGQEAMVLTPICAHALTNRPLVVAKDATLRFRLTDESAGVVLTLDGQWAHSFLPGDEVRVSNAARPLRLFASDKGYFDILREKLHWGRSPIGG